jgi:hypothetical protein
MEAEETAAERRRRGRWVAEDPGGQWRRRGRGVGPPRRAPLRDEDDNGRREEKGERSDASGPLDIYPTITKGD